MCWGAEITQTSQGSSTRSEKYCSSVAALSQGLVLIWSWVDVPKVLVWNLALRKLLLVFLLPLFFRLTNGDNDADLLYKSILRLIEEKSLSKAEQILFLQAHFSVAVKNTWRSCWYCILVGDILVGDVCLLQAPIEMLAAHSNLQNSKLLTAPLPPHAMCLTNGRSQSIAAR